MVRVAPVGLAATALLVLAVVVGWSAATVQGASIRAAAANHLAAQSDGFRLDDDGRPIPLEDEVCVASMGCVWLARLACCRSALRLAVSRPRAASHVACTAGGGRGAANGVCSGVCHDLAPGPD